MNAEATEASGEISEQGNKCLVIGKWLGMVILKSRSLKGDLTIGGSMKGFYPACGTHSLKVSTYIDWDKTEFCPISDI